MPILNRTQIANPRMPGSRPGDEILTAEDQPIVVVSGKPPMIPVIHGTEAADNLKGTDRGEVIYGYENDNWIDGGKGADQMIGGLGNDYYTVDDKGDKVIEKAGEATGTPSIRPSTTRFPTMSRSCGSPAPRT
jgi:Ca2+-binding RTX toxin-like protein